MAGQHRAVNQIVTCTRCGREWEWADPGVVPGPEGFECYDEVACAERVLADRLIIAHGVIEVAGDA